MRLATDKRRLVEFTGIRFDAIAECSKQETK